MQFLPKFTPELELPSTVKDATAVMISCGLPAPGYATTFNFLVAVLVAIDRMPNNWRRRGLFAHIGQAINGLGNGDDALGFTYMTAAGEAVRTLYAENMWDLNQAWSGIGNWRA